MVNPFLAVGAAMAGAVVVLGASSASLPGRPLPTNSPVRSLAGPVAGEAAGRAAGLAGSGVATARAPAKAWTWPVPPPTQVVHRFDPPTSRWGAGHRGVDLAAMTAGQVLAPSAGRVTFAGQVAGRGVVVIEHAGGLRSTLEPARATVPVGAVVERGTPVAVITDESGHCAPAACLHWGVLRGEVYLDPQSLISGRVVLLPLSR